MKINRRKDKETATRTFGSGWKIITRSRLSSKISISKIFRNTISTRFGPTNRKM